MSKSKTTALKPAEKQEEEYRGVIMLAAPPIDKIVARALMRRYLGLPLPIVGFYADTRCSPEQMLEWERAGLFPIDIGDEKYHQMKIGSATAYIVGMFGFNLNAASKALVALIDENNRTGKLKAGGKHSVAWLTRELPDFVPPVDVIEYTTDVIDVYLDAQALPPNPNWRKELEAEYGDLLKETGDNFAPFSVAQYLRNLAALGRKDTRSRVRWWLDNAKKVVAETERGRRDYTSHPQSRIELGSGRTLGVIETDDRFIAKAMGYDESLAARIVRHTNGQTTVAAGRNMEIGGFARALLAREPDRWYFQAASGTIMNGSVQYTEVPATALSVEELVELFKKYPPRPKQSRR